MFLENDEHVCAYRKLKRFPILRIFYFSHHPYEHIHFYIPRIEEKQIFHKKRKDEKMKIIKEEVDILH